MTARSTARLVATLALVLAAGCPKEPAPDAATPQPREGFVGRSTIAVLEFEDTSPGQSDATGWIGVWLADRFTQEFEGEAGGLQLVERRALAEILGEQRLGSGELASEDTRLELGRVLGAQVLVLGNYMRIGDTVRLDARAVDVETGVVARAASAMGPASSIDALSRDVAGQLAGGLGLELNERMAELPGQGESGPFLESRRRYAEGLRAERAGDAEAAVELYRAALELDPDNPQALAHLEALLMP